MLQWHTEGGGVWGVQTPPPRNSEGPPKSCQTQPDCENCWKMLNLGRQHPQDVRKKGSKILKLPPVRNCFTLAMTNKLVIINSLKVPKIKNILLYEIKFLVPNYSCLQNPWLGGYRPQIPVLSVLCPQLNLLTPPPFPTTFLGTPLQCSEISQSLYKMQGIPSVAEKWTSEERLWFMKVASHVTNQSSVHSDYGCSAIQTQQIIISVS